MRRVDNKNKQTQFGYSHQALGNTVQGRILFLVLYRNTHRRKKILEKKNMRRH